MNDVSNDPNAVAAEKSSAGLRKYLIVVDESSECRLAVRFSGLRAAHSRGGVILLSVIEPFDFQHWLAVDDAMRAEANDQAEELLNQLAAELYQFSGVTPERVIREGKTRDQILDVIAGDPSIRVLVLAASAKPGEPGPLVNTFTQELSGSLPITVLIVPGNLSEAEVDELA